MGFQTRGLQSVIISIFGVNIIAFWLARNKFLCLYYILIAVIVSVFPLLLNTAFMLLYVLFCFLFLSLSLFWKRTRGRFCCILQNKKIKCRCNKE